MTFLKRMDYWADTEYIKFKAWATYKDNDIFKYSVNMELTTLVKSGPFLMVSFFIRFSYCF